MEIYTNAKAADRTVFLPFPDPVTSIDAYVYKDGVLLFEISTVEAVPGEGFSAVLPLHLLQHDGQLKIHWTIKYLEPSDTTEYTINRVTPVEVVTQILSKAEIKAVWDTATDDEVETIEKVTRHVG